MTHAVAYLLYPLLGWLSDVYFTRYKVIRLAFIIMCVVATVATGIATAYVLDGSISTRPKQNHYCADTGSAFSASWSAKSRVI